MLVDSLSRFRKVSSTEKFWNSVDDLVAPHERRIQLAFRQSLADAKAQADMPTVMQLVKAGRYDDAVQMLLGRSAGDQTLFMSVRVAVGEAAMRMATVVTDKPLGMSFVVPRVTPRLDTLNPAVVDYVRRNTWELSTQLTADTQAGLKEALVDALRAGEHPFEAARQMRDALGLTPRDAKAVANYRAELKRQSKAALGRALRDKRFDSLVQRQAKMDNAKVERIVQRYQERLIKHRAETVAMTEAARALNMAQQVSWRQSGMDPAAMRRRVLVAPDERTCAVCHGIADMGPVGLEEPFVTPDGFSLTPPFHPRCRCVMLLDIDLGAAIHALRERQ